MTTATTGLQLGIFLPVANNGWVLSPLAPPAPPTFALNAHVARRAEAAGFHFLLAQSVWRGHGGATGFWDTSLECFTTMAGLARETTRLGLVASVQPLLYPAPVAAKMAATIDDLSDGRFGVNIVAGAHLAEYDQMGLLPDGYAGFRYDLAEEWVVALRRLWTEATPVSTTGRWVQLDDCISNPKPLALEGRAQPPIFCAGTSERGRAFAVAHGTHAFIGAPTMAELAQWCGSYRDEAAEVGRSVQVFTAYNYLVAPTDEEAQAEVQRYRDHPDLDAIADLVGQYSKAGAGESLRKLIVEAGEHVFFGGIVAGSPSTIAAHVRSVAAAGLDGLLCTFVHWDAAFDAWESEIGPALRDVVAGPEACWGGTAAAQGS